MRLLHGIESSYLFGNLRDLNGEIQIVDREVLEQLIEDPLVILQQRPLSTPMGRAIEKIEWCMTQKFQMPHPFENCHEPTIDLELPGPTRVLVAWKEEILRSNRVTLQNLQDESEKHADITDRATSEADRTLELRARDRQRKLIAKIDAALLRIEEGTYGYCEETGERIGLKRLDARPVATLSLEAQEQHERRERVYRNE